ncbi:hypothetical protein EB796_012123 [Bugula neritina]|uniref:Uncharacterized protein n=1 Tax=Bugula neritina TaxID=10212 RepID=A0A7J7JUZ9_BUGNE|nr:hypothetical protein EB796_012123 [Bugula neritina]
MSRQPILQCSLIQYKFDSGQSKVTLYHVSMSSSCPAVVCVRVRLSFLSKLLASSRGYIVQIHCCVHASACGMGACLHVGYNELLVYTA